MGQAKVMPADLKFQRIIIRAQPLRDKISI
ncbi:uncharacterized protein G2W53_011628 [Senna tora]|uniref:Uncharacterized protein n=1 Tax=Senna tora TaxID=362788 RepID=A0A834X2E3_9FABA|nr:uncharacterized protein G2W53_011628 [Senna tora]